MHLGMKAIGMAVESWWALAGMQRGELRNEIR